MSNVTSLHVVRPVGNDWHLMTAGGYGHLMPAGRHVFETREDAWEMAAMMVREKPGVATLYDRHGAVEWTLRHRPGCPETWIAGPLRSAG